VLMKLNVDLEGAALQRANLGLFQPCFGRVVASQTSGVRGRAPPPFKNSTSASIGRRGVEPSAFRELYYFSA